MPTSSRRATLYVRVSTADRGHSVENQLQPLQEAAGRLGWSIGEFERAMIRDRVMAGLDALAPPASGSVSRRSRP